MRHMRLTSTDSSMWINGTTAGLLADCTRNVRGADCLSELAAAYL